jgi:hypothetical protein
MRDELSQRKRERQDRWKITSVCAASIIADVELHESMCTTECTRPKAQTET